MLNTFVPQAAAFLARAAQIQNDPGIIVGPIAKVFGYIIDFVFNLVYAVTVNHSLGLSIIFLTIIVRALMLPLAVKQQQSMVKMQKLAPEIEKIKNKYGNSKDPEIQQKMSAEQQALYAKNKVNPLSGCLPMLITMPLFFGLSYIMNQSYMFISKLGGMYNELSSRIINEVPHFANYMVPLSLPHVPQKIIEAKTFDIGVVENMSKVLNKFSAADWNSLFSQIPTEYLPRIKEVFEQKQAVEIFFGLPLIDASGWAWPGIIIPILAGLTTFLSSWLSGQLSQTSTDEKNKMTQRTMMIVMPFFMAFMTVSLPAGVGLYWITSSVFQVVQQLIMNMRAGIPVFGKKLNTETTGGDQKEKRK